MVAAADAAAVAAPGAGRLRLLRPWAVSGVAMAPRRSSTANERVIILPALGDRLRGDESARPKSDTAGRKGKLRFEPSCGAGPGRGWTTAGWTGPATPAGAAGSVPAANARAAARAGPRGAVRRAARAAAGATPAAATLAAAPAAATPAGDATRAAAAGAPAQPAARGGTPAGARAAAPAAAPPGARTDARGGIPAGGPRWEPAG